MIRRSSPRPSRVGRLASLLHPVVAVAALLGLVVIGTTATAAAGPKVAGQPAPDRAITRPDTQVTLERAMVEAPGWVSLGGTVSCTPGSSLNINGYVEQRQGGRTVKAWLYPVISDCFLDTEWSGLASSGDILLTKPATVHLDVTVSSCAWRATCADETLTTRVRLVRNPAVEKPQAGGAMTDPQVRMTLDRAVLTAPDTVTLSGTVACDAPLIMVFMQIIIKQRDGLGFVSAEGRGGRGDCSAQPEPWSISARTFRDGQLKAKPGFVFLYYDSCSYWGDRCADNETLIKMRLARP
jgi:hypothetical protein